MRAQLRVDSTRIGFANVALKHTVEWRELLFTNSAYYFRYLPPLRYAFYAQ